MMTINLSILMKIFFTFRTNDISTIVYVSQTAFGLATLAVFNFLTAKATLETYLTQTLEFRVRTVVLCRNLFLQVVLHLVQSLLFSLIKFLL